MGTIILAELLHASKLFFLQPTLYLVVAFFIYLTKGQVKRERWQFRYELVKTSERIKQAIIMTIIFSAIVSVLSIGIGFTVTYEIIAVLSIVLLILTILFRKIALSASFSLGITYIVLLQILPKDSVGYYNIHFLTFTAIAFFIGIFLLIEAKIIQHSNEENNSPELLYSRRGKWFATFHISKLQFIPFFILLPEGTIPGLAPYWPYISFWDETYSLIFFPFFIGYHFVTKSDTQVNSAKKLSKQIMYVGICVLVLSISSVKFAVLAHLAIAVGIVGRLIIQFEHWRREKAQPPLFIEPNDKPILIAVRKSSPANKLGFKTGDIIVKVNDTYITDIVELDEFLQKHEGLCSFEVIDSAGKTKQITNKYSKGDRLELGLLLVTKPNQV